MSSIFTKIIEGSIPCYKVAETDRFIAFLDVNPNAPGHTLCVPKQEVDKIFDLEEHDYLDLMAFAHLDSVVTLSTAWVVIYTTGLCEASAWSRRSALNSRASFRRSSIFLYSSDL